MAQANAIKPPESQTPDLTSSVISGVAGNPVAGVAADISADTAPDVAPVAPTDAAPNAATDIAKLAGRGAIYITLSKLWFMVTGYGIHLALPRLMPTEDFGLYNVVTGVVSILNAVVVLGTQQTVSKYISQDETKADSVKTQALKLQAAVGGIVTVGFFLLAPVIASYLNDNRLTNYLRLGSLITLSYAFYSVFMGYFNGRRQFFTQALVDIAYSTLKAAFIVALVFLGFGVAGGVGGFALAVASVLVLSVLLAGRGKRRGEARIKDLFTFQIYVLLFVLVLNLIQKADLILVKALSSPDAITASENVAYYSAAINIANLTYQIVVSITFVMFPLISASTFADDRERTSAYVANTLRYVLMIMAVVATLFSANATSVLSVLYPADYRAATGVLTVVAFGMLFFGMFYVMTAIISASGRPVVSLLIGVLTLAVVAGLNAALISKYGLDGAGIGTTVAMFVGACVCAGYLIVRFQAFLPWRSALRITACSALVYALSLSFAPHSKVLILVKLAALGLIYLVALVVTRELGREDLASLKRVVRR